MHYGAAVDFVSNVSADLFPKSTVDFRKVMAERIRSGLCADQEPRDAPLQDLECS